jgi:hypothetical protein
MVHPLIAQITAVQKEKFLLYPPTRSLMAGGSRPEAVARGARRERKSVRDCAKPRHELVDAAAAQIQTTANPARRR